MSRIDGETTNPKGLLFVLFRLHANAQSANDYARMIINQQINSISSVLHGVTEWLWCILTVFNCLYSRRWKLQVVMVETWEYLIICFDAVHK